MYPAFAKDQLTTNRAAENLGGMVWLCVSKQGELQGSESGREPSLLSKPFAHRNGRSFGLSISARVPSGRPPGSETRRIDTRAA